MHSIKKWLFVLIAGLMIGAPAYAGNLSLPVENLPDSSVEFVSSQGLYLRVSMPTGWHTYSNAEGQDGMAPRITWESIDGFIPGDIQFPNAHIVETIPKDVYGYEGTTDFLVPITVSADQSNGSILSAKAKVNWLVCKDVCIPFESEASFILPVVPGQPAQESDYSSPGHEGRSFGLVLLLAFFGGLILNLMPCVLPVISLKLLYFSDQSNQHTLKTQGLAYTSGVLVSFWIISGLLVALRATGESLGWGFQLQSPVFVGILVVLFGLLSLNLLGLFELGARFTQLASLLPRKSGTMNAFFHGCLAVVVATPCSAPFMGTAIGVALLHSASGAFAIFTVLGIGFALPFLLVALIPSLQAYIPKPGQWMIRFRQVLGAMLLGTVIWLVWVFVQLISPTNQPVASDWQPFSPALVTTLEQSKHPYFLDFTAAWCVTCQVNKVTTLDTDAVQSLFRTKKITLIQADWTHNDPEITKALAAYGRQSVPLYIYFDGNDHHILPAILTVNGVLVKVNAND
ncbi:hypothetical protein HOH87_03260 [bacterium]|jgi:thiol:disulfide interchange protein|nr:hypothetical protein [bacterium]